jgi:hypothetical protein
LKNFQFRSIFELGSNCGRNLYHIQQAFPDIEVGGLEICPQAVEFSRTKVQGDIYQGSLYDLNSLLLGQYDVVFSMATLVYVTPDEIGRVIDDTLNITQKMVLHFEDIGNGQPHIGATDSDQYWANDLFEQYTKKGLSPNWIDLPELMIGPTLQSGLSCVIPQ